MIAFVVQKMKQNKTKQKMISLADNQLHSSRKRLCKTLQNYMACIKNNKHNLTQNIYTILSEQAQIIILAYFSKS
jgi:hypothetical protein